MNYSSFNTHPLFLRISCSTFPSPVPDALASSSSSWPMIGHRCCHSPKCLLSSRADSKLMPPKLCLSPKNICNMLYIFWIRFRFVNQKAKRVTAFSSPEGEERENLDSADISEIPFLACHAPQSGDQIIFFKRNRVNLSKEHLKKSRWSSIVTAKVVIGLVGSVFFISTKIRANLKDIFYCFQVVCVSVARKISLDSSNSLWQFGAITSVLQNRLSVFPSLVIPQPFPRISYVMDVTLERNPISYILFLMFTCFTIICIGGLLFSKIRSYEESIEDSFWDAWACVSSSSTHLKFTKGMERAIGFILAMGGLLFYSLLISTMTAQFKSHMDWLREGAHSEVMENGHIVICGMNNHLTTVLKQLNKSHEIARRNGLQWPRKQTVLLLSEHERKITEKMISYAFKELHQLNIHTRSGNLSNTISFEKVAAGNARSIIVLASTGNKYEADAESVLTVLALQPLLENKPGNLVVEVLDLNTLDLLKSCTRLKVNPLQNLSSKILVQCSRQPGLIDVYRELLEHDKQVINLRTYLNLAGISYQEARTGFPKAIVCGLIRDGKIYFDPKDSLQLKETDKLMLICAKNEYKQAPNEIVACRNIKNENSSQRSIHNLPVPSMNTFVPSSTAKKFLPKAADWQAGPKERILILGWHSRVIEMIMEYDDYVGPGSELIIVADTPVGVREQIINRKKDKQLQNIHVIHQFGNPMSRTDLKAAILNPLKSARMSGMKAQHADATKMPLSILVIAEDTEKIEDRSRPDKKAVLALLLAEDTCKQLDIEVVSLVAEFINVDLGKQVMNLHPHLTAVGTDEIVGLVTSQVVEEPEVNDIWTELLNSWGNEIYMKDIRRYIKLEEMISFAEISERAIAKDEVAIGFRIGGKTVINPSSKDDPLSFTVGDSLVVISEFQYSSKGL